MSARKLFADELAANLDELLFASPSHRSVRRLCAALERLPRWQQDAVLHWTGVAAQTHAELAFHLCAGSPRAFEVFSTTEAVEESTEHVEDDFKAWALAAMAGFDDEGLSSAQAVIDAPQEIRAARQGELAACFADVEARLTRFVRGLSGRPLVLDQVSAGVGWTDTEKLFLPLRLAAMPTAEENRRLYKAMSALLWAQTRYGTFHADLEAAVAGSANLDAALRWLAVYEAIRLEARIAVDLPGLAREIAEVRGPWPAALEHAVATLSDLDATVHDSLVLLAQTDTAVSPAPTLVHAGAIDPAAAARVRAVRMQRDAAVVRQALNTLRGVGGMGQQNPDEALIAAATQSMSLDGDAASFLPALPPDAKAAAESLIQDLGNLPPELLSPAGEGGWSPLPDTEAPDTSAGSDDAAADEDATPDCRYDEWDYRRNAYRKAWCHLYEREGEPCDESQSDYVGEVRRRHAALIRRIRRRFEVLRGEDRIHRHQLDGEDIDIDALVEAHADRRSGAETSPRVFTRRQRTERSLAAMFMVDMSGSTKGWINDAEREALIMMCEALETLGDRYAIYGFSGWTRKRADIYRIKGFRENYGPVVETRIAGIEAKDYTRMGVAVRHLSHLLHRESARHKLLITLSDGRPDDFGDEYRGTYGIEDTRRALQEARQQGIRSYCVTIDRHGADYLPHLYGPAHYTVLADVKKLPLRIADIYRKLTS